MLEGIFPRKKTPVALLKHIEKALCWDIATVKIRLFRFLWLVLHNNNNK